MITKNYEEYVVEFTVTIVDPTYSKLLSDPDGPQYNVIKQELTNKVRGRCDFTETCLCDKRLTSGDVGQHGVRGITRYKTAKVVGHSLNKTTQKTSSAKA